MLKVLKDFMGTIDMSDIPIGPQSELIEQLENLNHLKPRQFPKLEVTKKFNWKPGTYKIVKDIRSHLLKDNKYKSVIDIFNKPDRFKHDYYLQRFKRSLNEVKNLLIRKRWNGDIWIDDDAVINDMKEEAIEKVINLFESYNKYNKMINNHDIQYITMNVNTDKVQASIIRKRILNDSYRFKNNVNKVLFDTAHKCIYIIHPFNDIVMNAYHYEELTPMFKFKNGHVLGLYELSVRKLMYHGLGRNAPTRWNNYSRGVTSKFWFRPEIQGTHHPFVHYPGRYSSNNNSFDFYDEFDKWEIRYSKSSSTCYGNYNFLQNNTLIDIPKWCENVYSWLTTFRIGITNPLNNITTCYYGDPIKHDLNVEEKYYDIVGTNTSSCHNTMENYFLESTKRIEVCDKYCSDNLKSVCNGHIRDIRIIKEQKLSSWNKNLRHFDDFEIINADSIYFGNFNWSLGNDYHLDDEYPTKTIKEDKKTIPAISDQDLQANMLEWVKENS